MNQLAITVGVILFPGLISTVICDKITAHSQKWDSFKYGIYSFIFGVLCYVVLQALAFIWHWITSHIIPTPSIASPVLNVWTIVKTQQVSISPTEVLGATILSPAVAAIAAFTINHKLINRTAQILNISSKYGDENLYSFFLNAQNIHWIYVRDIENNLTYQGKIVSFSEADDMQEMVLSQVTVFTYKTSAELYSIPSLYLSKPRGSFIIEAIPLELLEKTNGKEAN